MPIAEPTLAPPPGLSRPGTPTWEVAYLFPPQGEWEESDYLSLGTNWMIEFSDGCLEVLPMPTLAHHLMVDFLVELLKGFVREHTGGRVLFAPLPVRLRAGKYREPDVIYLTPARLRESGKYPEGADLVVEIVSEGEANRERDLVTKRSEYAKAGISEYWIVDPQDETITVLTLDPGGTEFRERGIFSRGQQATSALLEGFAVTVSEVLDAGATGND